MRKNRDRLKREIKFLRLLHHPNIVRVYDVQEADGCIYIIMEYASGGELFDYIVAHVRVKEDEARCFFRQVLSAIDYCHKVGGAQSFPSSAVRRRVLHRLG